MVFRDLAGEPSWINSTQPNFRARFAQRETRGPNELYDIESEHPRVPNSIHEIMSRTLYSPKLSDDVVRRLYREGLRRRMPMTRLADELLRDALADVPVLVAISSVGEDIVPYRTSRDPDAA